MDLSSGEAYGDKVRLNFRHPPNFVITPLFTGVLGRDHPELHATLGTRRQMPFGPVSHHPSPISAFPPPCCSFVSFQLRHSQRSLQRLRLPQPPHPLSRSSASCLPPVSHQAADAAWHAILLPPPALLTALAGADFDGDTNAIHRVLDFGRGVVFATRIDRMGDDGNGWVGDE